MVWPQNSYDIYKTKAYRNDTRKPFLCSMKKLMIVLIMISCLGAQAQKDSLPPFKRFPVVPAFKILQADSSIFTKADLPRKKPVLVMVFSPDCDHCKHATEEIIQRIDELKKIEVVMATVLPYEKMKEFFVHYDLQRFKNIRVGRDTDYLLPVFFNMRSMPFLALYDKNGDLIHATEGSLSVNQLLQLFNK